MSLRAYIPAAKDPEASVLSEKQLVAFAERAGLAIAVIYREEGRGRGIRRPALFRLIEDAEPGDVLLVETLGLLAAVEQDDWGRLRRDLPAKGVQVVALDIPAHAGLLNGPDVGPVADLALAITLDILEVDRKRRFYRKARQAVGILEAKATTPRKYPGRRENMPRNAKIMDKLREKTPWGNIMRETGATRATLAKLSKRVAGEHWPGRDEWLTWEREQRRKIEKKFSRAEWYRVEDAAQAEARMRGIDIETARDNVWARKRKWWES